MKGLYNFLVEALKLSKDDKNIIFTYGNITGEFNINNNYVFFPNKLEGNESCIELNKSFIDALIFLSNQIMLYVEEDTFIFEHVIDRISVIGELAILGHISIGGNNVDDYGVLTFTMKKVN